jgi:hypothetical protein
MHAINRNISSRVPVWINLGQRDDVDHTVRTDYRLGDKEVGKRSATASS